MLFRRILREVNETHPKLHDYASVSEFTLAFSRKRQKLQPAPAVSLHPVPTEAAGHVGIGRDRVLVFQRRNDKH